jgi:hypothetical protein
LVIKRGTEPVTQKYKEWFKNIVITMINWAGRGHEDLTVEDIEGRYADDLQVCLAACGAQNHKLGRCREYRTACSKREDADENYKDRRKESGRLQSKKRLTRRTKTWKIFHLYL